LIILLLRVVVVVDTTDQVAALEDFGRELVFLLPLEPITR